MHACHSVWSETWGILVCSTHNLYIIKKEVYMKWIHYSLKKSKCASCCELSWCLSNTLWSLPIQFIIFWKINAYSGKTRPHVHVCDLISRRVWCVHEWTTPQIHVMSPSKLLPRVRKKRPQTSTHPQTYALNTYCERKEAAIRLEQWEKCDHPTHGYSRLTLPTHTRTRTRTLFTHVRGRPLVLFSTSCTWFAGSHWFQN